jgi:hypothetical protein
MPAQAEFPAAFDGEADYLNTLNTSEQAFQNNLGSVVSLRDGGDLLVGNVPAYVHRGAPADAETQRVELLRTALNGNVTYGYTVRHLGNDGAEVAPPTRASFFNGFGVERLFDHTPEVGVNARFWAESTTFDHAEGVMAAITITGENTVAEAAQEGAAAENRARRHGFLSKFRMPWPRRG